MTFPLKLTTAAIERLIAAKNGDELSDDYFIRASVKGGGCSGFQNELAFDNDLDPDEDLIEEFSSGERSIRIAMDSFSAMYMQGVELDYITSDLQEGFKFSGGSADRRHCACGSSFSE
jgi:iron-sulfur cluster assembly protein